MSVVELVSSCSITTDNRVALVAARNCTLSPEFASVAVDLCVTIGVTVLPREGKATTVPQEVSWVDRCIRNGWQGRHKCSIADSPGRVASRVDALNTSVDDLTSTNSVHSSEKSVEVQGASLCAAVEPSIESGVVVLVAQCGDIMPSIFCGISRVLNFDFGTIDWETIGCSISPRNLDLVIITTHNVGLNTVG